MAPDLFLIDAAGPFFVSRAAGTETNWSKAPFELLEQDGGPDESLIERIGDAFTVFASRVARLGYNALVIDDLAHMVCQDWYPDDQRVMHARFAGLYRRLLSMYV